MTDDDRNLFGEPLPRLGAPLFIERWSNRKAFYIGLYTGQGMSIPAICDRLGDGVTPNTVSGMITQWGYRLPAGKHTYGPVKVMLAARDRTKIAAEGGKRGLEIGEICRQVLANVARDDLWKAVLDA
jgi:hypothetical protein